VKTFLRAQLAQFLEAIDGALTAPLEVIVIGGSAAALHYGVTRATHDIDTWTAIQAELAVAAEKARALTGLAIPVEKSGVTDAPFDFGSRLERALPHLKRLRAMVPERHDLVLMKAMRCYEHDLQAIAQIHEHSPLDLDTLIRRFNEEMDPIGEPSRIRGNMLAVVERLFPDAAEEVARRLRKDRP
jgi:hypothetical protein